MMNLSVAGRRNWPAVLLLVGLIVWLVVHFPRAGLWYDEALTAFVATDSWATLWGWCTQIDIQVPLHYVVLRLWAGLVGQGELALRVISVFSVLLAVAAAAAIGRRVGRTMAGDSSGNLLGVSTAALLAFMPGLLWIGYEVRAYALGLALYGWATFFLLVLIDLPAGARQKRLRWLLLYALTMIGALYTHYTALGAFAGHLAILILSAWMCHSRVLLRTAISASLLVGFGFAPWLPVMLARGPADRSYYVGNPIPATRSIPVMLGFKLLGRDDGPDAAPGLVGAYGGLTVLGTLSGLASRQRGRAALTGLLNLGGPVVITVLLVYFKPKLAGRYAWPAWIGLDLLAALALVALARLHRLLVVAALVGFLAWPWLSGHWGQAPASGYREAYAYLCTQGSPDDIVVLRDGTLFVATKYYGNRPPCEVKRYTVGLPMALITDVDRALTLKETSDAIAAIAARRPPSVWVIAWQGDVMDPQGLAYALLDGAGRHSIAARMFGDVRLDRYEFTEWDTLARIADDPVRATAAQPITPVPGGPSLHAVRVFAPEVARTGETVVLHAWWLRGETLQPDLRVSARITTLDGGWTYTQVDQPPAGWKYVDDRWQAGIPALGRYELSIGPDVPEGKVAVRYVIYDAANRWPPVLLKVDEITVKRTG